MYELQVLQGGTCICLCPARAGWLQTPNISKFHTSRIESSKLPAPYEHSQIYAAFWRKFAFGAFDTPSLRNPNADLSSDTYYVMILYGTRTMQDNARLAECRARENLVPQVIGAAHTCQSLRPHLLRHAYTDSRHMRRELAAVVFLDGYS